MESSQIPEDFIGQRFLEVPLETYQKAPKVTLDDGSACSLKEVGLRRYRWSAGLVELCCWAKVVRRWEDKENPLKDGSPRKRRLTVEKHIVDPHEFATAEMSAWKLMLRDCAFDPTKKKGTYMVLDDATWSRLKHESDASPGECWLLAGWEKESPGNFKCDKCGKIVQYLAGNAPLRSGHEVLSHNEVAPICYAMSEAKAEALASCGVDMVAEVLSVFGGQVIRGDTRKPPWSECRYLCIDCVPAGWVYCGACKTIHLPYETAECLKPFADWIRYAKEVGIPDGGFVYKANVGIDYKTKKPKFVRYKSWAQDRFWRLVQMIGRSSVCPVPARRYKENAAQWLDELTSLVQWASERIESARAAEEAARKKAEGHGGKCEAETIEIDVDNFDLDEDEEYTE